MPDFLKDLFTSDTTWPNQAAFWDPSVVWLIVVSNSIITLAFCLIIATIAYLVHRRPSLPYRRFVLLFCAFLTASAAAHALEVWTVWHTTYRLTGMIRAVNAVLAVTTAIYLVRVFPSMLNMRSAAELAELNTALEREIAERKRSEAALETERHLFRTLIYNLPDRIFFKDAQGRFIRNNPAHLKRLGVESQSQAFGKTDADFFPPEHASKTRQDEDAVMRTGSPMHKQEMIVWPDGRVDWALVTKLPLPDQDGKIFGTFGISRDINEIKGVQAELMRWQKELESRVEERTEVLAKTNDALRESVRRHERTERALRQSEERIRLVLEATPSALLMADSHGRIALVNSQAERLFGYEREELLKEPVERLLPERYREAHPGLRSDFFKSPAARPMGAGRDLFGLRKDGTEVPVEIGLSPIQTDEGDFVLASIIDITERKRAEDAVQNSLNEKDTLLKEVHHRVKNNLQIISSVLQLQAGYIKDPAALSVFRDGQNRIRSMALIHEKLYEAGNFAQIDFAEYVQSLAPILTRTYLTPGCSVKLTQDIKRVSLNLDTAIPFGLILNEAISNSLKHAFRDRPQGNIWVRLHQTTAGAYELSVQDDGVGLPEDFDWENSSSLGLRLIRILAEQLQGSVEIRRQPGTTVTIVAPPMRIKERSNNHGN